MIEWKDSHSQRSYVYTARVEGINCDVVYGHISNPDKWVLTCAPWFTAYELSAVSARFAKREAEHLIKKKLLLCLEAFK